MFEFQPRVISFTSGGPICVPPGGLFPALGAIWYEQYDMSLKKKEKENDRKSLISDFDQLLLPGRRINQSPEWSMQHKLLKVARFGREKFLVGSAVIIYANCLNGRNTIRNGWFNCRWPFFVASRGLRATREVWVWANDLKIGLILSSGCFTVVM